jgi:hypothetical protein
MRRGVSVAGLLFAWLCAQGALTETMQVFAWGRMFAGYRQTMTWSAAADETFDPNKPCEICRMVCETRESGQRSPAAPLVRDTTKFILILSAVDDEPELASVRLEYPESNFFAVEWQAAVPKPPPRTARA